MLATHKPIHNGEIHIKAIKLSLQEDTIPNCKFLFDKRIGSSFANTGDFFPRNQR